MIQATTHERTTPVVQARVPKTRTFRGDAIRRFFKNRAAVGGLFIVLLFLFGALFGPYVAPRDFLAQDIGQSLQGPSSDHWLGTDALGRDVFSRLLHGARTAAIIAFTTTTISLILGVGFGTMAGLMGGRVGGFVMWIADITMSIPSILLAMLITASLKRPLDSWLETQYERTGYELFLNTWWLDFLLVFGALALISWPEYARLIRGQVLSVGESMYVEAARSIGASTKRIMTRHVVPNSLGPVMVAVSQGMGAAILLESSLSFLGIGVQPPNASWGSMLSDSLSLWRSYPHLMLAPALTLGVIQISFVFIGDGLNDALNPRQMR